MKKGIASRNAVSCRVRKVHVRLPGKGNSSSHGTKLVHLIITMIEWFRASRLSIKNSLSCRVFELQGVSSQVKKNNPRKRSEIGMSKKERRKREIFGFVSRRVDGGCVKDKGGFVKG